MNIERRFLKAEQVKLELRDASDKKVMRGYAAVFNSMSENLGGFREIIKPGAFANVLKNSNLDCYALFNHNPDHVLANNTNGSLRLKEDDYGLLAEWDFFDTSIARDVKTHVEAGNIRFMSFAFTVGYDGQHWENDSSGTLRIITDVRNLFDVSPVTYPAYKGTSVDMRSYIVSKELDVEKIASIIVRAERKLSLSEEDISFARNFMGMLGKLVATPDNTTDNNQRTLVHLKNTISQLSGLT
jgi:HK97 family phage prohead protease